MAPHTQPLMTRPPAVRPGTDATPALRADDRRRLEALRRGDEGVFAELVDMYHGQMLRLARTYVRDRAVAEEVVHDAWIGLIQGIDRFEGRSSLKTWLFRIVVNIAMKRGTKERRSTPMSALAGADGDDEGFDPDRFLPAGHRWAGHWQTPPSSWGESPEERILAQESRGVIDEAIAGLPAVQRQVITLRDVYGWSSEDVCELLQLTEGNQRVLLHRARGRVRVALDRYLGEPAD
jgi:RNA polymerase sigma-70 factor (ECF subfamily)